MEDNECIVNDAIALVLYIERILGVAPLIFNRTVRGYKATVSRRIAIFGSLLTSMSHFLIITIAVILNYGKSLRELPLGFYFLNITSMSASAVGSYGSYGRMKRIVRNLNTLNKIKYYEIVNNRKPEIQREIFKIISFLVICGLIHTIDFLQIFQYPFDWIKTISFGLLHIDIWRISIFLLEHMVIQCELLKVLNTTTKKIFQLVTNYDSNNSSEMQIIPIRGASIMKPYLVICNIAEDLNRYSGVHGFLLLACCIFNFMLDLGRLVHLLQNYDGLDLELCIYIIRVLFDLSYATLFVEPCHKIHLKVIEIQHLVAKLVTKMTAVGKPLSTELDLMLKQLHIIKPTLAPLRMFIIQRSILITAIGFLSTYGVILIQFIDNQWT